MIIAVALTVDPSQDPDQSRADGVDLEAANVQARQEGNRDRSRGDGLRQKERNHVPSRVEKSRDRSRERNHVPSRGKSRDRNRGRSRARNRLRNPIRRDARNHRQERRERNQVLSLLVHLQPRKRRKRVVRALILLDWVLIFHFL